VANVAKAVPALIKGMGQDPSTTVRVVCANALGNIGRANLDLSLGETLAALEAASQDRERPLLAAAAQQALVKLRP
jgi:HEAT repeat protein